MMRAGAQPAGAAMMRLSREHGPNGKPLLRAFKPQTGVRTHLRGAAPTEISQVASMQQQRASVYRAGLAAGASTRQAAAQRSSAARLQATAQKRRAPPQLFLAPTMTIGQAPRQVQNMCSRQPRSASRNTIRQPVSPRAGRTGRANRAAQHMRIRSQRASAQLARSRAERASTLAQRRAQATPTDAKAAEAAAARVKPGAHKQHAHASRLAALASGAQQALRGALHRFSRQPRAATGQAATTPEKLRAAARHAHLMQSSAERGKGLSLKRNVIIMSATSAAEDGPASGAHSPIAPTSQQGPMQADEEGAPATRHQPACASAAQQDAAAAHEHTDPGQTQHKSEEGTARSVDQGRHVMGSPGAPTSAGGHDSLHCVDLPAALESDTPSMTGAAGVASQLSSEGDEQSEQQPEAPAEKPSSSHTLPSHSSEQCSVHSVMSSGESPQASIQAGGSPAAHAASPSADDKCIMDEATQPVEAAQPSKAARKEKRARKQRRRAKKLAAAALTTEQASLGAPSPAPAAADAAKGTPPSQAPMTAEAARPQQQQPVRKVKPSSPITLGATRMAGKEKTWGNVLWGRRVHCFRATVDWKVPIKAPPKYTRPPRSRLGNVSPC